jgi:uncharacterized protein (DUF58 family)
MSSDHSTSLHLTKGGWFFLFIALAITGSAFNLGVNMTYLLASLLLAVLLIAFIAPPISLHGTICRRRVPEPPHAGEPFMVEMILRRPRARTAARLVTIEDPLCKGRPLVLHIPPRLETIVAAVGRPRRRGVYPMPAVRFVTGFPFGLTECRVTQAGDEELVVYPARGELGHIITSSLKPLGVRVGAPSRTGMPGEDVRSLREYVPGDNPRWIHWRASAHLGKLHVRDLERERSAPVLIVLDSRIPPSLSRERRREAWQALEIAVSFAAEVCRFSLREGSSARLVGFFPEPRILGGDRPDTGETPAVGIHVFMDALARLRPSSDESAEALLEPARRAGLESAWRVLAVSLVPETASSLAETLGPYGGEVFTASSPGFARIFRTAAWKGEAV